RGADGGVRPSTYDLADSRVGYLPDEAPALLERPAWTGPVQEMWAELDLLRRHLGSASGAGAPPHRLIAVSLVTEASPSRDVEAWMRPVPGHAPRVSAGAVRPPAPGPRWPALGLDVADMWLLSGLSNCGYREEEASLLRARFGPHLNRHHLFDEVEPAAQFARLRAAQVPGHAPFFVYRIWSIMEESAS